MSYNILNLLPDKLKSQCSYPTSDLADSLGIRECDKDMKLNITLNDLLLKNNGNG